MQNILDSTKKDFFYYLSSLGISPMSHKNYRSDISHFHGWLKAHVKAFGAICETLGDAIPFLSTKVAGEYKTQLLNAKIPAKTVNRRLSTLRHFGKFLTSYQTLDFNFMEGIENATSVKKPQANAISIINEFRAHLEAEKSSPNTIKNYLSDVRQFLSWLETNQETLNSKS